MNEMNQFERRLENRLRTFAVSGIRPVDSAAVARAATRARTATSAMPTSLRWLRLPDRRGWSIVAAGLLVVLAVALLPRLQGVLIVGSSPAPTVTPTLTVAPATGFGLAYAFDGDIYVADADGANPTRIGDGDPDTECGALYAEGGLVSPDGRYVAYRSGLQDQCRGMVYVSEPDGRLVASFPGAGWEIGWAPDSTRLATWLEWGPDSPIGIYSVDGTLEAELDGSLMCCGDYDPIWSPDGAAAVMIKAGSTVLALPIDGSAPVRVLREDPRASLNRSPNWWALTYGPDRTRAVLIDGSFLVMVDADGTNRRVLADMGPGMDFIRTAAWSPSGERIAYVETRPPTVDDGSPGERASVLRFVDVNTGAITESAVSASGQTRIRPIAFSPDGDLLLFSQSDEDGAASLWVVNANGSGARMLVDGTSEGAWFAMAKTLDAPAFP